MSNASDFVIENGVLKRYVGSGGDVVIPDGVTSIGFWTFRGCTNLTSITVPESVTIINSFAFDSCINLTNVTIPDSITRIGQGAFDNTAWYDNQPNGLVYAGNVAYKYKGDMPKGTSVVINEGTIGISDSAFSGCDNLTSVIIPDSVKNIGESAFMFCEHLKNVRFSDDLVSIGKEAFQYCKSLEKAELPASIMSVGEKAFSGCGSIQISIPDEAANRPESFVIENGVLKKYKGPGGNVVIPQGVTDLAGDNGRCYSNNTCFSECSCLTSVKIPEGVTNIGSKAFLRCENLRSVIIPDSVTEFGKEAFWGCSSLQTFEIGKSKAKLTVDFFGWSFPSGLIWQAAALYPNMADGALKKYLLNEQIWAKLELSVREEIFLTKQSKTLSPGYESCIAADELEPLGKAIQKQLDAAKPSAKDCSAAASYMTLFYEKAPVDILKSLYERLKQIKAGAKAVKTVEEHVALMEKLGSAVTVDDSLSPVAQKVMEVLIEEKKNVKDLEKCFKDYYGLTAKEIPSLKTADGAASEPIVGVWMFTAHEKQEIYYRSSETLAGYEKPGLCPKAAEIAALLDQTSLQAVLLELADENLGLTGRSKKMFLAYPICRYADEELMTELTKRAPKWRSSVSGNDAPPLATFRKAAKYSNTRAAMLFAEKYHELDDYAKIRGTDADTIRDCYLSDVGLDEQGGKTYDLGNQIVTARLQKDLSFIVELPNGKTAKSLPKKGADTEKYETAKKDFSEMKKSVKKILKNRGKVLFEDFLSGKKRKSADWQNAYLHNPLLREAASLVVWSQGKKAFTLTASGAIDSAEQPYTITDKPIKVAHPMEMTADDISAWQKYFTNHGLKQPFAQVWEPVRKPEEIAKDRYAGCYIPYYRFLNQERHGIYVEDNDFHNEISIGIKDCIAYIDRIDYRRHDINVEDCFEVKEFGFKKYNRQVNHIVAYLDRVTVWDRVRKDDVSVMDFMSGFTLAQITEFITAAQESNAVNVLAALMEYKNNNFSDFDPMDEFTLEW